MKKQYTFLIILSIVLGLIFSSLYFLFNSSLFNVNTITNSEGEKVVIGVSLGTLQEERWLKDRAALQAIAKQRGVILDLESVNNNKDKQREQIETLILKGVDVIIVVPNDATALTEVLEDAREAGIDIISYDRLIKETEIDAYVSFDNEEVGRLQAQSVLDAVEEEYSSTNPLRLAYIGGSPSDNNATLLKEGSFAVLQPYIADGSVQIVLDTFITNWDPEIAYQELNDFLDKGGTVDAVVSANDGNAFGVINALDEHDLSGAVPVSGQDAESAALKRILVGSQTATVYKPIPLLAQTAIDAAIALALDQELPINAEIDNDFDLVPSILLDPTLVTSENIEETVIKDGYHTKEDVFGS